MHWEAGCVDLRRDRVLWCLRREGRCDCRSGVFAEGGQGQDDEELVRLCELQRDGEVLDVAAAEAEAKVGVAAGVALGGDGGEVQGFDGGDLKGVEARVGLQGS